MTRQYEGILRLPDPKVNRAAGCAEHIYKYLQIAIAFSPKVGHTSSVALLIGSGWPSRRTTMTIHYFRVGLALALTAASTAAAAGQATFRVVATLSNYAPSELTEGSPGVFYTVGNGPALQGGSAISVSSEGSITTLTIWPGGYNNVSQGLVGAANGRFYSSVEYSSFPANIFSVASVPDSGKFYAGQSIDPMLTQSLPDGTLLGDGIGPDGLWYLLRCGLDGAVTTFATLPSGQRVESVTYASDGNFYGVSLGEDIVSSSSNYAFRATSSGVLTTLYTFPLGAFERYSSTPLLQATDGNLYGSTVTGGANGTGMIYKLTLAGQFTLLYSFDQGKYTAGPTTLIEGSDGNLYGNAQSPDGVGQLFRITKSGQYTVLYQTSGPNAVYPCYLAQGSDGIIYGSAYLAASLYGEIFALDAGLPKPGPWVQHFTPQSGTPGAQVRIWGYNLLSAAVQFNGVPATTVSSSGPNYVLATVPPAATTGPITITTPGGTVVTGTSFTVE
jgi:uncharacterized repeat protein (TIGR03803 family)